MQLVHLLRQGLTNRQISAVLHYSAKTIEVYVSRLYQKVGCHSRLELVLAAERGEISLPSDAGAHVAIAATRTLTSGPRALVPAC